MSKSSKNRTPRTPTSQISRGSQVRATYPDNETFLGRFRALDKCCVLLRNFYEIKKSGIGRSSGEECLYEA